MLIQAQLKQYISLTRLNKPIGILLLLWPTLWALYLASGGFPKNDHLFIFISGVILMRSAGCIMNDVADRHLDSFVARTKHRPLATQAIAVHHALLLAACLAFFAFILVLFCNALTIKLAFVGAALTVCYPFLKRYTYLPQVGLGCAFAWGVPMAFAAELGQVGLKGWFLFSTALIWPIIYDTMYAMEDRNDDLKVGIKSTAILFASRDRLIIGCLQLVFIAQLMVIGKIFNLNSIYYKLLLVVSILCVYQQYLLKKKAYFAAFLNNNWVGCFIWVGIFLSLRELFL